MQLNKTLERMDQASFFGKTISTKYGNYQNIDSSLIKKINFLDKTFVNRLDDEKTIKTDENFVSLLESIRNIGLLNPVYLLETDDNYVIINGWRRLLALNELYKSDKSIVFYKKAIILKKDTPLEFLEKSSLDENTKRKDLSILELSYKFNKLSSIKGISIEDCLKKFNIARSQFYVIKKAINFHPFIKEFLLENVGPLKAELLNKILGKLTLTYAQNDSETLLMEYSHKSREDLKNILKEWDNKLKQKNDFFEIKKNNRMTIFKIKEILSDEDSLKIEIFLNNLLRK
ncbi:ParB N-terminal domain-containing protein [Cetobacterium sp.]|uniref:ParB N-terminal domain-containing protein n=1 Tax=Cetobacterium sp. TaxID=2071632 RepID=UPI002FC97464